MSLLAAAANDSGDGGWALGEEDTRQRTFVVLVNYIAPVARIDEILGAHRDWLERQFEEGHFLVSGPRVPRTGGLVLARARSRESVMERIHTDPFWLAGVATYEVLEFTPTGGPLLGWLAPERRS